MRETPLSEWLLQTYAISNPIPVDNVVPLNRWLFEAIRAAILSAALKAGQKLPPTRELAAELKVARITVMHAYERLVDEGYLEARIGAGTFVSDTQPDAKLLKDVKPDLSHAGTSGKFQPSLRARKVLSSLGASARQMGPFTPGIPDIQHFPHASWQRLLNRAARFSDSSLKGYGSANGLLALRQALAQYLVLSRGVRCDAEQIVITHSAHQAIDLCIKVMTDPGDTAWIEDPGYWGTRNLLAINAVNIRALPVDGQGVVSPFSHAGRRAKEKSPRLIFVTPSHQYPSGVVMSLARRRLWIELAAQTGAYIVEDDYDSEFRYREAPLPSLQGLDYHDRTLYIGSFSKTLYPGLRLGFIVTPPALTETFSALHNELYRGGQLTLQFALAEFIAEGHFNAHLRRMRKIYAERQAVLHTSLLRHLGDAVGIPDDPAGLHLAVHLPYADDVVVERHAASLNLVARPLSAYYENPAQAPSGLVLGFGGIATEEVEPSVQRLAQAVEMASTAQGKLR